MITNLLESIWNKFFPPQIIDVQKMNSDRIFIVDIIDNCQNIDTLATIRNLIIIFEEKYGYSEAQSIWSKYFKLKKRFFEL